MYMNAVQLMTGHGGWPLNCLALPDGRPIYGGTYYRRPMDARTPRLATCGRPIGKSVKYAEQLTDGCATTKASRRAADGQRSYSVWMRLSKW